MNLELHHGYIANSVQCAVVLAVDDALNISTASALSNADADVSEPVHCSWWLTSRSTPMNYYRTSSSSYLGRCVFVHHMYPRPRLETAAVFNDIIPCVFQFLIA